MSDENSFLERATDQTQLIVGDFNSTFLTSFESSLSSFRFMKHVSIYLIAVFISDVLQNVPRHTATTNVTFNDLKTTLLSCSRTHRRALHRSSSLLRITIENLHHLFRFLLTEAVFCTSRPGTCLNNLRASYFARRRCGGFLTVPSTLRLLLVRGFL